jgi:hypothetical protein
VDQSHAGLDGVADQCELGQPQLACGLVPPAEPDDVHPFDQVDRPRGVLRVPAVLVDHGKLQAWDLLEGLPERFGVAGLAEQQDAQLAVEGALHPLAATTR